MGGLCTQAATVKWILSKCKPDKLFALPDAVSSRGIH